jgi:epoxyqueuosine reductase
MAFAQDVLAYARALGFDFTGAAPIEAPGHFDAFEQWLSAGYHGEMAYMAGQAGVRANPAQLHTGARTIIVVGANYHPGAPPATYDDPVAGRFARFSWAADYHEVIRKRLHELDSFIRVRSGRTALGKACVDTAPLLERDLVAQAGLGFIGRNTCLITPGVGSWTFLGALLVPELLASMAVTDGLQLPSLGSHRPAFTGCGRCTRCLEACPTRALVAPYVLDARRCISYLTIELRGPIPRELRPLTGNWVFGCDICQEVCPYNRAAPAATWPALAPDRARAALPLRELLALGEQSFRARFQGTSVLRAKRRGLVRNACVGAGNSRDPVALPALESLLADGEPMVRGHAAWAIGRIGGEEARRALFHAAAAETDAWVSGEIQAALAG